MKKFHLLIHCRITFNVLFSVQCASYLQASCMKIEDKSYFITIGKLKYACSQDVPQNPNKWDNDILYIYKILKVYYHHKRNMCIYIYKEKCVQDIHYTISKSFFVYSKLPVPLRNELLLNWASVLRRTAW